MPSFGNTPEALLGRNDSKNPATTCRGITGSGRPCRRALAASRLDRSTQSGVVAIVEDEQGWTETDFYCWQHKDQAEARLAEEADARRRAGRRTNNAGLYSLQERTSIDTLVNRLGLDNDSDVAKPKPKRDIVPRPPRRTDTHDFAMSSSAQTAEKISSRRPKQRAFWASLCCFGEADDDYMEVVRHRKRVHPHQASHSIPSRADGMAKPPKQSSTPTSTDVYSQKLLSIIPKHVSPQISSALLSELVKPFSPTDEDGYVYIFWLTPQTQRSPSEETARSLLVSDRPPNERRISDVMTEFSFDENEDVYESRARGISSRKPKTVMLKIGRANNITRRMNEWQRQCGYALNLVRWYPHVPSSPLPSPSSAYPDLTKPPRRQSGIVRQVPHVKRVERLIHLELADKQVKRDCTACGKEHREWFQIEANQAGIKAVDDCVKKWISWAEGQER